MRRLSLIAVGLLTLGGISIASTPTIAGDDFDDVIEERRERAEEARERRRELSEERRERAEEAREDYEDWLEDQRDDYEDWLEDRNERERRYRPYPYRSYYYGPYYEYQPYEYRYPSSYGHGRPSGSVQWWFNGRPYGVWW